jgi:hypothetical protein
MNSTSVEESLRRGTCCIYEQSNLEQMADKSADFQSFDGNIQVPRFRRGSFSVLSEVIHQHALAWWVMSRHENHVVASEHELPSPRRASHDSDVTVSLVVDLTSAASVPDRRNV